MTIYHSMRHGRGCSGAPKRSGSGSFQTRTRRARAYRSTLFRAFPPLAIQSALRQACYSYYTSYTHRGLPVRFH